jgi:hypothetical protein
MEFALFIISSADSSSCIMPSFFIVIMRHICFESPERLYVGNLKNIVGCILPVLNDEVIPMKIYSSSLYKKLGLKSEPPISLVKQNL